MTQKETLSKTIGGFDRLWPALSERDLVNLGEEQVENAPPPTRAQCCSMGAIQKLLKEELRQDLRFSRDSAYVLVHACAAVLQTKK